MLSADRFKELLESYGGRSSQWPPEHYEEMQQFHDHLPNLLRAFLNACAVIQLRAPGPFHSSTISGFAVFESLIFVPSSCSIYQVGADCHLKST